MVEQFSTYSKGFPFPCPSISNLRPFTAPSMCSLILISGLITLCRMKSVAHLKYQSMNLWIWSKTIFHSTTLTMMEDVKIDIRLIQPLLFSFCSLRSQGEWNLNSERCCYKPLCHTLSLLEPITSQRHSITNLTKMSLDIRTRKGKLHKINHCSIKV